MKGTKIYSVLHSKCPVCNEGDVFLTKNPYDLKNLDKMPIRCEVCDHKFELESGFWYGSMYVSYALTVGMGAGTFLITYLIYPQANVWLYIGLITAMVTLLAPLTFRFSRLIWMNMFSKYDALRTKKA